MCKVHKIAAPRTTQIIRNFQILCDTSFSASSLSNRDFNSETLSIRKAFCLNWRFHCSSAESNRISKDRASKISELMSVLISSMSAASILWVSRNGLIRSLRSAAIMLFFGVFGFSCTMRHGRAEGNTCCKTDEQPDASKQDSPSKRAGTCCPR